MDKQEAEQLIQDTKSRKALWEFLWKAGHIHEKGRPVPSVDSDEVIKEDLRRILFPKSKWSIK